MKFIVSSQLLVRNLQSLFGVINPSNTLPILDNFLFSVGKDTLTVSASDLETSMTTTLQITSKDEGVVAIPARILLDLLKSFPDTPITFSVNTDTKAVRLTSEYGEYNVAGLKGEDFPKAPEVAGASSITVPSDVLARAIAKTVFATGNDDLRPVMSGVYFELKEDGLSFVATDAHKLVKYSCSDFKAEHGASFIMPKKPLNQLKNVLANEELDVTVTYNDTNASFSFGEVQLTCRLIEGRYPNYEAVIPKENPNVLTINRQAFLGSVKRVSYFSNKTTHQVKLKIAGSELQVSAEDPDFSNNADERLTCSFKGNDMTIGFNSRFLVEMLANLDTDEVILEMSEPNRAGILTPAESPIESEHVLMLVMPVMIND
ncbi:MAG: DNA polymerase III subunit beta [Flavobacteriales bacterium]|nr:DNA polymerase III subunit beta [Flavobacteriales bacterium]